MEPNRKRSLLITDAEPLARRGLLHLLAEQSQWEVCAEAESIAEARELCGRYRPDVLVLDPAQSDGFALIKDLPRWSPRTRVVVLTGLEDPGSVQRAFQAGVWGYVTRRDPVATLLGAIAGALSGERFMSPRAQQVLLGELARGSVQMEQGELSRLSHREQDVFRLIGAGRATRAVAEELHMSVKTVETHRQRIRVKLGCASGAELLRRAVLFREHRAEVSLFDPAGETSPHV